MAPLFCRWLWHSATLLCDGSITCGLDDPFKLRNYGNVKTQTLREILDNTAVKERRHRLLQGHDCGVCQLHTPVDHVNIAQLAPSSPYPYKLVVETSIRCNIRCNNSICNIANDATFHARSEDYLSFDTFKKAFDEIGPHLSDLFFFNYGEPFINKDALRMLQYARSINERMTVTSSTNGLLLARGDTAETIVEGGLVDWLCFTIGGCDEESYGKYHKSSSFAKAIEGMRRVADAKRRTGRGKPIIHWRYLLFNWNDKDEQIARAQEVAREVGVDEFKVFLTGTPLEGRSLRRAPSTPGFDAIAHLIDYDAHFRLDPFAEAGLWAAESHPHLGPLSWTGRKARISAIPTSGKIKLRLARPDLLGVPQANVTLNTPWGSFSGKVGSGQWADNDLMLPEHLAGEEEAISIDLVTDRPFTPLRHGVGVDGRELGVMVSLRDAQPRPNPFRAQQLTHIGPRLREGCDTTV